ncbi:MAG TPA: NifU family protein [Dehalococcoidia bacterium]|nr:NifU family protein [Dehalococcoidia bacterium]
MREKIEAAIDRVRPALQADGGDVELIEVKDGVVSVRLTGACGGCPMATMTLKNGIERIIREEVPEVKEVVAV